MATQNLIQRATITFPIALSLRGTEDLLQFVARNLPADINWQTHYFGNIYHDGDRKLLRQYGTVSLSAMIRSLNNPMAFDSFESVHSRDDSSKIESLRAVLIPGYDLVSEYRVEAVKLWDDVRKQVSSYFPPQEKKK